MKRLGKHLIAECCECDAKILNDMAQLEGILLEAATAAGATPLGAKFHNFSPCGVTGILLLAESHISIHTWPELEYAAVDVFTCGDNTDVQAAVECISSRIKARHIDTKFIERGMPLHFAV